MPPVSRIDAKDRAILYNLDKNARQSNSAIARKTRLSKEVVNYRIKNLIANKIINGFFPIVNSSKLGYVIYRVFIRFQNVDIEKEKEIIEFLRNLDQVTNTVVLDERYDLAIFIWAKDVFRFKEIFEQIITAQGRFFQECFVTAITNRHFFLHNHLFGTTDLNERIIGGHFEETSLDKTDFSILCYLFKDARTPLLNIAKKINVSPNTVKQRIKQMEEKKVIVGYRADINSSQLGYQHYKIFLHLVDVSPEVKSRLKEYLKLNPPVIAITEAVGRADLEFQIQVKNSLELRQHLGKLRTYCGDLIRYYRTTQINREYNMKCIAENCLKNF
ncbi:Lrp/AsnC family transcriptional regulator [Candidatus Woesearchaeota archaeon]|jgi:Lrp/AsnC family transcriptional regulator, regulator for asnA, asnC and gidA|nr:Lrp/AsnC family transcriptional regulator [Candidatus Woesearchaeota archaeon]